MKRSLKILFLASWYPNKKDPFLGNFVQRHGEAISERNEVFVVSAFSARYPETRTEQKGNLTEITIYFRNEIPFLSYVWSMIKGIRLAKKAAGKFDLCHVNVAWPAGFFALFLGIPFIVTEHFSGYLPMRNHRWIWPVKLLTQRILSKAYRVVPVSEFLREAIADFAPDARFEIIPNVVNEDIFHYHPPPENQEFTFLHISTLEDQSKNITGMLDSLYKVNNKGRVKFRLIIGGDGDLDFLERELNTNKLLGEQTEVVGPQSPKEVAGLMARSHALLMFSHYETQSCTILESLCSGRPVVTTAVGGIPEITDDSNSIRMADNDKIGMARAIERIIDTYQQFDTKQISEKALRLYRYKTIAQSYEAIYVNVLKSDASNQ